MSAAFIDEVLGDKGVRKCTIVCVSPEWGGGGAIRLSKVIVVINYYFQLKSCLNYLLEVC